MSYTIRLAENYVRVARKFFKRHPQLQYKYRDCLHKLSEDPFQTNLKAHLLQGHLAKYYAISLTYNYRLLVTIDQEDRLIVLCDVGSHDEVYRER